MMNGEIRRRHILFLIPSLYGGGAERVCCLLASEMAKHHDVTVAYFEEKAESYPLNPDVQKVVIPQMQLEDVRFKRIVGWKRRIQYIKMLKKQITADVSVSFLVEMNVLNAFSGRPGRVICSERANPKKYKSHLFPLTRVIYGISDHVVFQTEQIRNLYGPLVKRHSSIIVNPVFVRLQAHEKRNHRIITMGRLTEQKNQAMLIRAFAAFLKEYPEYSLSIYGEGELLEELRTLAESLEIADCVRLEGNQSNVHELIRDAEMFVLSSNFEGMSNALLECMTMGIACISTRCEGSAEVIHDGENGLLIPIGGELQLMAAMKRLAGDEVFRRCLAQQAIEDAEAFAVDKVIKEWENIFFNEKSRERK